jgi:hypothetical protein
MDIPNFVPPRDTERGSVKSQGFGKVYYGREGEGGGGLDGDLIVEFYIKPYPMEYMSETLGFPIFQDRIWVRIVTPGNNKNVWDTLAQGIEYDTAVDPKSGEYHTTWEIRGHLANGERPDPEKYPNAWGRFMKKGEQAQMGWPVEEWGVVTRSYAESLKMMNIPTVEALAALSDSVAGGFMGGRKYRDLARCALDERSRNQIVSQEQAKSSRLEEQLKLVSDQNRELQAMVQAMQAQVAQVVQGSIQAGAQHLQQGAIQDAQPPRLKTASVRTSERTRKIMEASEDQA